MAHNAVHAVTDKNSKRITSMNQVNEHPVDGSSERAPDQQGEASETGDIIRIVAVAGPLLIGLVIALYLVLGAGGLIGRRGSLVAALGDLAWVLITIVPGGFLFLYKRHWLDASKRWCLRMPVGTFAIATLLGFLLAWSVRHVDYSRNLPDTVDMLISEAQGRIPAQTVRGIVTTAYVEAVEAQGDTTSAKNNDDAKVLPDLPARERMIGAISTNIVGQLRNYGTAPERLDGPLRDFANLVRLETLDQVDEIFSEREVAPALQSSLFRLRASDYNASARPRNRYDMVASFLVGLCLTILLFVPDSVRRLVRPAGTPGAEPSHAEPPLSVYFGFVFGILLYLITAYIQDAGL